MEASTTTTPVSPEEAQAQIDALRAQLAERDQRLAQAEQRSQPTGKVTLDVSDKTPEERAKLYEGWPQEGGSDAPQPWDLQALGLRGESQQLLDGPDGAEDTVSPVQITHRYPILTSGSADQAVHQLGRALDKLGFANSVSRGENPFGVVDQTILEAVHAFRSNYGVEEDPTPFGGRHPAAIAKAANHIGPWTIEAIRRAVERLEHSK